MSETQAAYTTMTPVFISEFGQARFVDISFWYRTGGIDWGRLRDQVDGVIIRAGQGYYGYDELLNEHVDKANEAGVPYHTYWQLDRRQDIEAQMRNWITGYGVDGHKKCLAIEYCGGQLASAAECLRAWSFLADNTDDDIYGYSRVELLINKLGNPAWVRDYKWIIAQYPPDPGSDAYYRRFETFLRDYEYEYPSEIARLKADHIDVVGWQFTQTLEAQHYFANARTEDPKWSVGLKNGDGIVSMQTYPEAMEWFLGYIPPDPPDPPDPEDPILIGRIEKLEAAVVLLTSQVKQNTEMLEVDKIVITDHEKRIQALEQAQPAPKDTVTATAIEKVVAFQVSGDNAAGKPIMVVHEPRIRYDPPDRFEVYPERVDADGEIDYYRMERMAGAVVLYVRADKVSF